MRRIRRTITLLTALGLHAVAPIAAQAQEGLQALQTYPGGSTYVSLHDYNCVAPTVTATSPGFQSPAELLMSSRGYYSGSTLGTTKLGTYVVTAKCNDTTYMANFSIIASPAPMWTLAPLDIDPGSTITATTYKGLFCQGLQVTSPGFTAPIQLGDYPRGGRAGSTTVIATPGTYTATIVCGYGATGVKQFKIKGTPPTTTPPTTPPGKPKPPVVKPRGAADTGGGGTA